MPDEQTPFLREFQEQLRRMREAQTPPDPPPQHVVFSSASGTTNWAFEPGFEPVVEFEYVDEAHHFYEGDDMPTMSAPPLPPGWRWYSTPTRPGQAGRVHGADDWLTDPVAHIQALIDWAREHNIHLNVYNFHNDGTYRNMPNWFNVRMSQEGTYSFQYMIDNWGESYTLPDQVTCGEPGCEEPILVFRRACEAGHVTECPYCGASGVRVEDTAFGFRCSSCAAACVAPECERLGVYEVHYQDEGNPEWGMFCDTHAEERYCELGDHNIRVRSSDVWAEDDVCPPCRARCCTNCETLVSNIASLAQIPEFEGPVCPACRRNVLTDGQTDEAFDEEDYDRLRITPIPGRENIRRCGIEIEGANGRGTGNHLAERLLAANLSTAHRIQSYHRGAGNGFCHVEADSSVDWELVVGPVNLADSRHITKLNKVMSILREQVKSGNLKLDLRCGLHIHVGAERVSMAGAYNLHHLYTFIEDPFYRLGSARWSVHRTMVHERGTHYCEPIPKHNGKARFARAMQGQRYFGLSFSNYLQSMLERCQCGATRYDSWDECECQDLGKCTFEFRLFNTTASQRKLHAYTALTQALVAKALAMPEITNPEEFPALPFTPTRLKDMPEDEGLALIEAWTERLRWIVTELPLTDAEKVSVRYCVDNSELSQLGDDVIESIFNTTTEVAA